MDDVEAGRDSEALVPTRRAGADELPEGDRCLDEEVEDPPRRRSLWWAWLTAFLIVVVGVAGLGVWVFLQKLPGMIRAGVVAAAAERGFSVDVDAIDAQGILPWDDRPRSITLRGVRAKSLAVDGVEVEANELAAPLVGFEPERIGLAGVRVSAPDIPSLLAFEESLKTGRVAEVPVSASEVRVRIARIADAVPLAAVLEVPRAQADKGQVSFDELKVDVAVPFVDLGAGPYAVDLERTPDRLWIVPRAFPKLRVGIDPKATRGFVEVPSITPEEIERIASVSVPGQRISAKGEGSLTGKDARSGTFDVTIAGFVPPHPRELSGIVFGDETRVTGKFRIDGLAIALDDLAVRAGSFVLKGTGRISLGGGVTLELKGSVGCTELAASAVGSHLGLGAAVLTRRIASGRLGGSVEVRVTVEGDVSSVEDLKVVPSAFVRCKVVI